MRIKMTIKRDPDIRFKEKILPQENGCWHFNSSHAPSGYPWFGIAPGKMIHAHRYSAKMHGMDIEDMYVCHTCDNPGCVNPDHLFVGSHKDNMKDMAKKNRSRTNLSVQEVKNIKRMLKTSIKQIDIATQLGVSKHQVSNINLGKTHKYI